MCLRAGGATKRCHRRSTHLVAQGAVLHERFHALRRKLLLLRQLRLQALHFELECVCVRRRQVHRAQHALRRAAAHAVRRLACSALRGRREIRTGAT